MNDKKESIPALKRKIERLQAINQLLVKERFKAVQASSDYLHSFVDYQMRNQQAMKLLNGEDV